MMTREMIYLAGLVHDIGKFWQRGDGWYTQSNALSAHTKSMVELICPKGKSGSPTHLHVLWTAQFLEDNAVVFNEVLDKSGIANFQIGKSSTTDTALDGLMNLASFHHRPATMLQSFIQLADWWSSGIDRRNGNNEEESQNVGRLNFGSSGFKKVPLFSIFNEVQINQKSGEQPFAYNLEKLDLQSTSCFFPQLLEQGNIRDLSKDYQKLWEAFIAEFKNLPNREGPFLESLLFLLKKYTWSIPSSTMDMANVSLFEHLKNTAAIADCLFVYWQSHKDDFEYEHQKLTVKPGVHPLLMVCCDVSGIQNFIYNIANSKAAVSLKGRSFYIQLIQEVIQREIITRTGAQSGHIIYGSGGKFYLLLPNTEDVREALKIARDQINLALWEKHQHRLYACLDWIPFCFRPGSRFEEAKIEAAESNQDNIAISNLGELWIAVTEKTAAWKGRKYNLLTGHFFDSFFGKNGLGLPAELNSNEVCAVTGEEGELVRLDERDSESPKVLKSVKSQVQFGRGLKDFDSMLILDRSNQDFSTYYDYRIGQSIQPLEDQGYTAYFLKSGQNGHPKNEDLSIDFANVIQINDTDFLKPRQLKGVAAGYGFRFYGGNKSPVNVQDGSEKTFHDLALNDQLGDSFLGVLRMDVDGLGAIFKEGFPVENKTFSAYATLSSALDYFFSGYINTIRNREPFRDWINIIYAGGDDLFVVGRWAEVIEFAEVVRKEFKVFVGNREDMSISGGLFLMGKKFPISLAAEEAGIYESMAKDFANGDKMAKTAAKNAICLFGQVVSWEKEFDYVKTLMLTFYDLCLREKGKISKGLLQKIIELKNHKDFMKSQHSQRVNDYSYRWNAAYYLARVLERYDPKKEENKDAIALIQQLQQEIFTNHERGEDRYLDLVALAARWTEFYLKENVKPI